MTAPDDTVYQRLLQAVTRRHFFRQSGLGIGSLALLSLLDEDLLLASPRADDSNPLAVKAPHFAPKAKSTIFLFMAGAPSQLDLLDPKPQLTSTQYWVRFTITNQDSLGQITEFELSGAPPDPGPLSANICPLSSPLGVGGSLTCVVGGSSESRKVIWLIYVQPFP